MRAWQGSTHVSGAISHALVPLVYAHHSISQCNANA
jgi:hypothetical protein